MKLSHPDKHPHHTKLLAYDYKIKTQKYGLLRRSPVSKFVSKIFNQKINWNGIQLLFYAKIQSKNCMINNLLYSTIKC